MTAKRKKEPRARLGLQGVTVPLMRCIPAHSTLLLAAFLVGRWSIGTAPESVTWVTQPVASGLADSTEADESDLPPGLEASTVIRVVDGDTLVLDGGERVRLIGVDTPETVHPTKPVEYFGREASAFTKRMAEGQQVYLEYESGSVTQDKVQAIPWNTPTCRTEARWKQSV